MPSDTSTAATGAAGDPADRTSLVAIDWGTSSLRGARLAADGRVLERRGFDRGVLSVPAGGFAAVFGDCFGDWVHEHGVPVLISGMAGSRQGWFEVPYLACAAGLEDLAAALHGVDTPLAARIAIVPGLSCRHEGAPDVMRGEETQVFGAASLRGARDALCVLPGTHSKWVRLTGGRIESFRTHMTGEVFDLLRRHSILARTLPDAAGGEPPFDGEAFDAAVQCAQSGPGLLSRAFGLRAMALFEEMPPASRESCLSGLVIGEELRGEDLRGSHGESGGELWVIGSDLLTARYVRALSALGCGHAGPLKALQVVPIGPEATWRGHHEIWKAAP